MIRTLSLFAGCMVRSPAPGVIGSMAGEVSAGMRRRWDLKPVLSLLMILCLALTGTTPGVVMAQAPQRVDLPAVRPVLDCTALAGTNLAEAVGAVVTLKATQVDTAKGQFCHVTGTIAPAIGFEVDLPVAKWTGRFLQAGCGGLCGMINASIGNAGKCLPATDGQFVVAASDLGHQGSPMTGDFASDPQKRIDFAYRANHLTALTAKALIRAYYGQAPRYSYFSGCSDGGREALMEAQRYPDDFDGISAGAPAMNFQVQNSFHQAWLIGATRRPDGAPALLAAKLPILHSAVIRHCDRLDGTQDGLLSDPRACTVDPAWVRCGDGIANTSGCLTAEEWQVAAKLYAGPTDAAGHRFLPGGLMPGSEVQWASFIPAEAGKPSGGESMFREMAKVVYRTPTPVEAQATRFPFTAEQFARVSELHALNDATDTDFRPFMARGGKLVMWHGWSDTSIAPMISVAYYKGVQQQLGLKATYGFLRLFMIPGVAHCGGGDGFAQVDTLSALMAWVEQGMAPASLPTEQIPERIRTGPPTGADGRGGEKASAKPLAPVAQPDQAALASRPVYPFPLIAKYDGRGDPKLAASYVPARSPVTERATIDWYGASLIAPGFQKRFVVESERLEVGR